MFSVPARHHTVRTGRILAGTSLSPALPAYATGNAHQQIAGASRPEAETFQATVTAGLIAQTRRLVA